VRHFALIFFLSFVTLSHAQSRAAPGPEFQRLVILKIDGLNQDLLYRTIQQQDPTTGRSRLPWFARIFQDEGVVFRNFYVRGISLSAPSWSMLDTGRHAVIRGNVEYDRYTGQVYDYLNFFPFYVGYARNRAVDMPGVEVLDRAGIPLISDRFQFDQVLQGFQLFQRGVAWTTLKDALVRTFSGKALWSGLESAAPISLSSSLSKQLESVLERGLRGPNFLYLDFFTGEADHEGHATSNPEALFHVLAELDALVGRVWTAIQESPLAKQTLLVVVSDHGMNNVPGILSQTFSLPDVFNSPDGGAHHVVTDREQLSDYKLKGINPLVHRVITPSTGSLYLQGQSSSYPTAWLDIDGNERAAVHLRDSDLNKLHILLIQLARPDLNGALRKAAARSLSETIDRHRKQWNSVVEQFSVELAALDDAIAQRRELVHTLPRKATSEQRDLGEDKATRRLRRELDEWQDERAAYQQYLSRLKSLLAFVPDPVRPFTGKIPTLVSERSLGERNSVADLEHYIVGPSAAGLVLGQSGELDDAASFRYVNYLRLLSAQRAVNNPQPQLSSRPIDFIATALPGRVYWLYGDEESQLLIFNAAGELRLEPARHLTQDAAGQLHWVKQQWRSGLPLQMFEDPALQLPAGLDRRQWLSAWHTEREWFSAVHFCRYSNGVIGIAEELSPVAPNVPGPPGATAILCRYEQRRRELVQPDFHVFAADHWNFNVRFPNPGGNHGSFLRISTHSVWMMAGDGLLPRQIDTPYDSLNFASTLLNLVGHKPPMPERVVPLAR